MKSFIFFVLTLVALSAPARATDVVISPQALSSLSFNASNIGTDRLIVATATNGSPTVTSAGLFPLNAVGIGGFQLLIGGVQYAVASVQSTSSLTLTTNFVGMTGTSSITWYKWVLLRVYNTSGFAWQPLGSTDFIQPSAVGSGTWYKQVACSVINPGSGNALYVPQFTIAATVDSPTNSSAKYSFVFFRTDGSQLGYFQCGSVTQLSISTPTPTTLAAICNYNQAPIQNQDNRAYSIAQIDARLKSCVANNLWYFQATGQAVDCLTLGSGLSIVGGVISATGGGGAGMEIGEPVVGGTGGRLLYIDGSGDLGELSTVTSNGTAVAFAAGALVASNIVNGAATLTLPTTTDTIVGRAVVESLSGKTLITPTIASFVNATHTHQSAAGGGTLDAAAIGAGSLALARGGTGASLVDPNADRILFWDDSGGAVTFLSLGPCLSITGTVLSGTCGGGGGSLAIGAAISGSTAGRMLYVDASNQLGELATVTSSDGSNVTYQSTRLRAADPMFSGQIRGVNGNRALEIVDVASAVNFVLISGNSAGNAPQISLFGSDPNITLNINSQGSGEVVLNGTASFEGSGGGGSLGDVVLNILGFGETFIGNTVGAIVTGGQLSVRASSISENALGLESADPSDQEIISTYTHANSSSTIHNIIDYRVVTSGAAAAAGFGSSVTYGLETDANVGSTVDAAIDKLYWKDPANPTASSIREFWSMDRAVSQARHIIAPSKSVADNVVTAIFTIAIPTGGMAGGMVVIHAEATDGTDFQSRDSAHYYSAVNKAGTVTASAQIVGSSGTAVSAGSLSNSVTAAAVGATMELRVQCDTTLVASPRVWFTVISNSNSVITIVP